MEPLHSYRGFTLVELMVVLAIIITLTGVVFTSQSTFNKTLELANTAYDVALTLRSAETYGLGNRVTTIGTTNAGYGLHFEKGASTFTLFADTNSPPTLCHGSPPSGDITAPDAQLGDCVYNGDGSGEFVQTYTLGNGIKVNALSAKGAPSVTSLDVVFSRPNPDAFITVNNIGSSLYPTACITLSSPQGGVRYVNVASSGQITANATSCL